MLLLRLIVGCRPPRVLPAAAVLFAALLSAGSLAAQAVGDTPGNPQLHKRSEQKDETARSYANPQVPSKLPSEASGEYQLGKPGDVIEIILDNNGLTGYISMLGKSDHDKEVPLTYFFDETQLDARTLSFTTKPVHGQWYSFEGTVVRGPALTREKEGYYLLKGKLTLHNGQMEQPRMVALPLARSENG
jgi:hypothetical protein